MHPTSTRIDPALLEVRLGAERWQEVRRAAWRGTPLEDGASAAAAELAARQDLRGTQVGLLAFLILGLAGIVALLGVGDGWAIALFALAVVGMVWSVAATALLRRSVRVHAPVADHDALRRFLDGHSPAQG
jgi:hypothetical protein